VRRVILILTGVIFLGIALFVGGTAPNAGECGDVNLDNNVDILDIVRLINFKYKAGPEPICEGVIDIDGNMYKGVLIGNQIWMAENLRVTHYRNGDPIPNVTDAGEWASLSTGAYCEYDNNPDNVATYGRLYNWHAVNDGRNVAPEGWHVPTDAEWQILADYLGGSSVAGGKLKSIGTDLWLSPNTDATDEFEFHGVPSGSRNYSGAYGYMGGYASYWSTTECSGTNALDRSLCYDNATFDANCTYRFKENGFSIRCIKD